MIQREELAMQESVVEVQALKMAPLMKAVATSNRVIQEEEVVNLMGAMEINEQLSAPSEAFNEKELLQELADIDISSSSMVRESSRLRSFKSNALESDAIGGRGGLGPGPGRGGGASKQPKVSTHSSSSSYASFGLSYGSPPPLPPSLPQPAPLLQPVSLPPPPPPGFGGPPQPTYGSLPPPSGSPRAPAPAFSAPPSRPSISSTPPSREPVVTSLSSAPVPPPLFSSITGTPPSNGKFSFMSKKDVAEPYGGLPSPKKPSSAPAPEPKPAPKMMFARAAAKPQSIQEQLASVQPE